MIRNYLPYFIFKRLFGDRRKYKNKFSINDSDWLRWNEFWEEDFYENTQNEGIGSIVKGWGYRILSELDLSGKTVLEIGPGSLPHIGFWKNYPKEYIAMDTSERHFKYLDEKLGNKKVKIKKYVSHQHEIIDIPEKNIDIILSFFSLEHLHKLTDYLNFFYNKLDKNGILVASIPNEGGIGWGLGRYLTTRRYVHSKTELNYDKLICFEHPNYADYILSSVEKSNFKITTKKSYPLGKYMPLDFNLVTSFTSKKINTFK